MPQSWRRDRPPYLRLVPLDRPARELELPDREARELLFLVELERRPHLAELAGELLTPEVEP